jgi:phosphoglycerol transferase
MSRRRLAEALAAAGVSVLCAAWALRLWNADLSIPLRYTPVDDTKFYLMLIKGVIDHGSYLSNSSLGAPFGQQLKDYPQGADNLSLLLVRALGVLTSNPALVANLFFLLTFALAGFTSHLVLRVLGVAGTPAGVMSVLFSLLSYHFFRGESHLLLSAYYAVPLVAYLFLSIMAGRPLLRARADGSARPDGGARTMRRARTRAARWLTPTTAATLAMCVVIGSDNLYYATFAALMMLAATMIGGAAHGRRAALHGLLAVVLVVVTVLANLSPSLIYRAEHGPNRLLERSAAFSEDVDEGFSLRLADLVLPAPESRVGPLRELAARYDHVIAPGYCEACYASLGTVGDVGFLWLVLGALATLAGAGGYLAGRRLLRNAGVGVLVALGLSTVGGVASLIEVFITPDIRAWNRLSVFIAFLSLLGAAVLLERLLGRMARARVLRTRRARRPAAALVCAAVLAFGVLDQTSSSFVPPYSATARQWRSDAAFVAQIERRMPPGAEVFQLPYVPFPEGYPETPVGDEVATYATKYELLRGYLHSRTLRWSYGAMKGRASDWQAALAGLPLSYVTAAAAVSGFDGLWVDPAGFEPHRAAAILAALGSVLEERPLLSPRGDLAFFDLRPYLARLRGTYPAGLLALLAQRTLHPLSAECSSGGVRLSNPYSTAQQALISEIEPAPGTPAPAGGYRVPDGQASDLPASLAGKLTRVLSLAPGATALRAPAGAHVLYASVIDARLWRFLGSGPASRLVAGLTGPPCGYGGG